MRRTDAIVGAVTLAVGGYALRGAMDLPYFYNGAPGPGFFPRYLALALILLGGAQLVQALLPRPSLAGGGGQASVTAGEGEAREKLRPRRYLRVAGVMAGWIVSVGLIDTVGFLIAMILLVLYLSFVIEGKRGWRPVLLAIVMPSLIYLAFSRFLQIQLPVGPLGF